MESFLYERPFTREGKLGKYIMNRINVKVVPGAKIEQIQESIDGNIKVWIRAKAEDGKANKALIDLLSKHFKVPKSSIFIVSGQKLRNKIVDIKQNSL